MTTPDTSDPPAHERRWWHLDLVASGDRPASAAADGLDVRAVTGDDAEALAVLMLAAYEGTIDSEDETIVEARHEVGDWLEHDWPGVAATGASLIAIADEGTAAGAVLVSAWEPQEALINFVMTAPAHKSRGLGRSLVEQSLQRLAAAGITSARAAITVGNVESERLFSGAGFAAGAAIDP